MINILDQSVMLMCIVGGTVIRERNFVLIIISCECLSQIFTAIPNHKSREGFLQITDKDLV